MNTGSDGQGRIHQSTRRRAVVEREAGGEIDGLSNAHGDDEGKGGYA